MAIHQEQDMNQSTDVAVTYTGTDDPYKDRIYRSGLTFTPGQTRVMPAPLAARFLRHSDVFKVGKTAEQLAVEAVAAKQAAEQAAAELAREQVARADADRAAAEADAKRLADEAEAARQAAEAAAAAQTQKSEPTDQDTAQVLEQQKQEQDEQRQLDDARFALLDSIESMDRTAVIAWADQHYRQKIPGNVSVAKARDMARGYLDQYGMPA